MTMASTSSEGSDDGFGKGTTTMASAATALRMTTTTVDLVKKDDSGDGFGEGR